MKALLTIVLFSLCSTTYSQNFGSNFEVGKERYQEIQQKQKVDKEKEVKSAKYLDNCEVNYGVTEIECADGKVFKLHSGVVSSAYRSTVKETKRSTTSPVKKSAGASQQ